MATNRRRVEQKYELFDDGEIKLDYKNILNVSSTETTDDVDEISNDVRHDENTVKFNDVRHTTTDKIWDTTTTMMMGDGSFEKERAEMTETFENEKSDIVKGFILEKRILSREHKQEKQDLISNFVKERQNMLDHFQKQVKDIEQKMTHTESKTTFAENSVNSEKAFNLTNESRRKYEAHSSPKKSMPGKLMIKVEGDRILTPDQFLSAMELEERFESEKEVIEKSFRKEKHNLKDKLEVEYSRKLLHEKEKHDREILTLRQEIDKLRNLKHEVADVWKTQASQLESEFFKERSALERHHSEEKDTLRRRLEERNQSKLRSQQEDYDRMIRDLRNELRQIKKEVTRNDEHVAQKPCDIRKEIESRLQAHYDNETRQLRQQNEKLNSEIKNLTTEKYDLSRKLRDIENDKSNESKFLKQHSEKQNKEYIEKMKRVMSQNEKLKSQISQIEKHKEDLKALIKNQENNNRNIEGRLEMSERTIVQYEDTVTGLRRENSNLSHEINLLRIEKEELSSMISQHNEQDRSIKIDAQRMQHNVEESRKKIVLLEREKLKFEKALEITRMELEKSKNDIKKTATKIEAYTKESDRLRSLLDSERSESKRLHERFKTDAELLRKKENENATTRTQLDNIKTQFETLKTRIEADNDKFFKIEKERQSLQKQLEKRKSSEAIQTKHELLKIQNSYCKEFSKRLEYVKANYEREIFNLKEKLGELMTNGAEIKFTPQPPQHCQRCPEHSSSPNRRAREVPVFQSNLPPNPSFLYNNNGNILDCSTKCSAMKQDHVSNHQDNFEHTNSLLNSSKQILEVSSEQLIRDRLSKGRQNPTNSSFRQPDVTATREALNSTAISNVDAGTQQNIQTLYTRVQQAVDNSDNNELRVLLRDVRKEVLMLNKLIDEQTPEGTPQITPRLVTPPTKDNNNNNNNNNNNLMEKMKAANQKTLELQDQLADKESEVNESKETLNRLYFENNELQRRLTQQDEELFERENSCDELYKRRLMLEKLVDRLQNRLRDETSKRRKLEQAANVIHEVSREDEEDLDDSTV